MNRTIKQVIKARRQTEGGGFQIRRPLPAPGVRYIDPILMIDEMGPVDYPPGEAIGAPQNYLAKRLQTMVQLGLVVSRQGLGGGDLLARSADSIASSVRRRTRSQIRSTPIDRRRSSDAPNAVSPTLLKLPGSKRRASGDRRKS